MHNVAETAFATFAVPLRPYLKSNISYLINSNKTMKRILLIFAALMALGGVKAAEYTTVEQLTENYFQLVVNDGGTNKSLYISDGWDLAVGNTAEVVNNSNNYYLFKVVMDGDNYILNCYNYAGTKFASWMGDAVNITGASTGLFMGSSDGANGNSKGQDKNNGGRWTIAAVSGGFTFQNAGDNYYIGVSPSLTSSSTVTVKCYDKDEFRASTDPKTFTSVDELTNDYFTLETNGKLICKTRAGNQNTEAIAVNEAISGYSRHLYKAELVSDGKYRIQAYTTTGATTGSWLGTYLNLPPTGGSLFFGACTSTQYGNDGQDLGLWTITKEDDGFVFQNVGNSKYMGEAVASDSKVYFTCKNKYSDMTYTRTATIGNYLTICLPYDATITGATVYTLSGVDSKTTPTKAYIEEVEYNKISAGKGYILKATATTVSAAMDAATVVATVTGNAGLVGFFDDASDTNPLAPVGSYVLSGGKWLKVVADQQPTMNMNRAYMNVSDATELDVAPARSIRLDFEGGETTAINSIGQDATAPKTVYNLQGIQVQQPRKGLYIIDGKKVIVK